MYLNNNICKTKKGANESAFTILHTNIDKLLLEGVTLRIKSNATSFLYSLRCKIPNMPSEQILGVSHRALPLSDEILASDFLAQGNENHASG